MLNDCIDEANYKWCSKINTTFAKVENKDANDFKSCMEVIRCVEATDDINQEAVINYFKYLGDKYLKAYYKLLELSNQRQTLAEKVKA